MNGAHVNTISSRLSLRPPQRKSLEILARVCDIIPLEKNGDPVQALNIIQSEFPSVSDFERDFPSLCFALATGVGKTRLMGAFIAYLFKTRNIRHFFVLAPNLTIYNKLTTDFTQYTQICLPGHRGVRCYTARDHHRRQLRKWPGYPTKKNSGSGLTFGVPSEG